MTENDDIGPADNHEIEQYPSEEGGTAIVERVVSEMTPIPDRLAEVAAMKVVYSELLPLPHDGRRRVLLWASEALDMDEFVPAASSAAPTASAGVPGPVKDGEQVISPREFISLKKPTTAVERIACLALYLTRYRDQRLFKTSDLVELNTEAASPKFANPGRDVDNADRHSGYLVVAHSPGVKQLTVRGEAVVDGLPDREAVKLALSEHPYKLKRSSGTSKKSSAQAKGEQ